MTSATIADRPYVLGHEKAELERLRRQADFYSTITEQALRRAGIVSGMRVLDAGCGAGDVTLLLAELVGASGEVIGVDRAAEAVATASERTASAGLDNVHFLQDDITTVSLDAPVDAVAGRLILMHAADPVGALQNLAGQVAPGGVVVFLEFDVEQAGAHPDVPLATRMISYVKEAFTRAGVDVRPGLRLHQQFVTAGLPEPEMLSLGRIEAAPAPGSCAMLTGVLRTLLPLIEQTGVATAEAIELDTLEHRLQTELLAKNAVVVTPPLIMAWTRVR
jgi:ubiquinone/menaquinone biosynthesis C-methylase UbiE